MNCDEFGRILLEQQLSSGLPAQAQEHLATCDSCRQVVRAMNTPISVAAPSPAELARIQEKLVANLRPVRPLAPAGYLFAALLAIFFFVAVSAGLLLGTFGLAAMSVTQATVIFALLAVSAGIFGYSLVHLMVPGSGARISLRPLPVVTITALAIVIVILFQFQREQNFWRKSGICLGIGTLIAMLATIPLWFVLRRGAFLEPRMTGVATGVLAALVGITALEIHCPILDASHILVGHLGVAVIGALAGYGIGVIFDARQFDRNRPY
jgi:hypothetical protein